MLMHGNYGCTIKYIVHYYCTMDKHDDDFEEDLMLSVSPNPKTNRFAKHQDSILINKQSHKKSKNQNINTSINQAVNNTNAAGIPTNVVSFDKNGEEPRQSEHKEQLIYDIHTSQLGMEDLIEINNNNNSTPTPTNKNKAS